jgi:hypothetical protein
MRMATANKYTRPYHLGQLGVNAQIEQRENTKREEREEKRGEETRPRASSTTLRKQEIQRGNHDSTGAALGGHSMPSDGRGRPNGGVDILPGDQGRGIRVHV